jgi:mannose-6-phosphate isomerase-like protein (cupin superfamily)
MKMIEKEQAVIKHCKARTIYGMIEDGGVIKSDQMTMGIARFDKNLGPMNPHAHAEEGMYVIDCANAYIRCGSSADTLGERELIKPGMIIFVPEGQWHVFEFEDGGFLDTVFCLPVGSIDRPE